MKILSHDIYCEDGVATAAIAEAADRLEEIAAENKKLKIQLQEANDYADRLVEHKDMICLPADLANLRKANTHFAIENEELKRELDDTKWSLDEARKNAGELIVSLDKENSLILEQRDRLAKALSDVTNSQDSTSMYRIAKQVLATLNQPEP
jgi:regulator of replication initiation timing